ncbi:hypothetical protein VM1G_03203 [Cytospora mali]|uniref:Uncharacterized protein n=1 Tax=Cytospora mali TaxID=578113 RepID=A0A194VUV9_CYTMA|nr:hypothetical protein VM1G_03203 [Valsa mali]
MARNDSGAGKPAGDDASESPKLKELEQAPTRKRNASSSQAQQQGPAKKRKSSPAPVKKDENPDHDQEAEEPKPLPRLTTPDLEFDYDRSKLKDPRPTPGREARPRYEEMDSNLPAELAARSYMPIELAKDTISKDLGIPWHKIGHEEVDLWEKKGFKKHKVEDWLTYSEEDRRRYMKMLTGGSHRK